MPAVSVHLLLFPLLLLLLSLLLVSVGNQVSVSVSLSVRASSGGCCQIIIVDPIFGSEIGQQFASSLPNVSSPLSISLSLLLTALPSPFYPLTPLESGCCSSLCPKSFVLQSNHVCNYTLQYFCMLCLMLQRHVCGMPQSHPGTPDHALRLEDSNKTEHLHG